MLCLAGRGGQLGAAQGRGTEVSGGPGQGQHIGGREQAGGRVPRRGGRKGQTHHQRADDEAGVAEHRMEGRHVALRDEDQRDVGEDQRRVDGLEKAHVLAGVDVDPGIPDADAQKDDEQRQRKQLFADDETHAHLRALDVGIAGGQLPVDAQGHEDAQGPHRRDRDMDDGIEVAGDAHRFGQVRQFLEGIAQQDQGQDLELFAHGPRKGRGDDEDQAHDLQAQDQGEGQLDGAEMAVGRQLGQGGRQHALALELHAAQGRHIDPEDDQRHLALDVGALPIVVQPVKNICKPLQLEQHVESPFRGSGVAHSIFQVRENVKGTRHGRHARNRS